MAGGWPGEGRSGGGGSGTGVKVLSGGSRWLWWYNEVVGYVKCGKNVLFWLVWWLRVVRIFVG